MRVVKAERWRKVATPAGLIGRHCSTCGSSRLATLGETVLDGSTLTRYQVVRCEDCGYDLLEPTCQVVAQAS